MNSIALTDLAIYSLMHTFIMYQNAHFRGFRGSSQGFFALLSLSTSIGILVELGFLIYFGWNVSWIGAIIFLICSFLAAVSLGAFIGRLVGPLTLSLVGFIGWPICAYMLFKSVP